MRPEPNTDAATDSTRFTYRSVNATNAGVATLLYASETGGRHEIINNGLRFEFDESFSGTLYAQDDNGDWQAVRTVSGMDQLTDQERARLMPQPEQAPPAAPAPSPFPDGSREASEGRALPGQDPELGGPPPLEGYPGEPVSGPIVFDRRLREEMIARVGPPPQQTGWQAHHIVPWGDSRSRALAARLETLGIDIHSVDNGVWLPAGSEYIPGHSQTPHGHTMRESYFDELRDRFQGVTTRDQAISELNQLRNDLRDGEIELRPVPRGRR